MEIVEVVAAVIEREGRYLITRRREGTHLAAIPDDEILARLLYPMVNEGAKILEKKIAIRASDIDVIRDRMVDWQRQQGDEWKPAALLDRLVAEGKGFIQS